jgi:uncharacterized integral membrane protein
MFSSPRRTPVSAGVTGASPDTTADQPGHGRVANGGVEPATEQTAAERSAARTPRFETRGGRLGRKARRARLHGSAIAAVALIAYLIALAVSNTARVKVGWVFGGSHVSLVWLVLFAAILGWLLGLATSARFHWRTRAPRGGHGSR